MGPMNWLAVILAGSVGAGMAHVWYEILFRARPVFPDAKAGRVMLAMAVMLLAATIMGHNFFRLGEATLDAKPWLYWMMSGGFALWFVAPALVLSLSRHGVGWRERIAEGLFWLATYLMMGTVFWLLG
jgi:hypothetical protein